MENQEVKNQEKMENQEVEDSPETNFAPQDPVEQLAGDYRIPPDRLRVCLIRLRDAFRPGESSAIINLQELPISLLIDAVNALGVEQGMDLLETVDLRLLTQRIHTFELLTDRSTPFFDRNELRTHIEAFLDFQNSFKDFLINTGLPSRMFSVCPWLEFQLGRLYNTRSTVFSYSRKISNLQQSYLWLRYLNSNTYSPSEIKRVDSHEKASFLKRLDPHKGRRLELLRGRFFQTRRAIIEKLQEALTTETTQDLVPDCCRILRQEFSKDEIRFFLEMDRFYLGADFRDHDTNQADKMMSPGGLSNLITVMGHVEQEISTGPFHHARRSFPDSLRKSLLEDHSESARIRYLRTDPQQLGLLDSILDELFRVLRSNETFWRDFSIRVQTALDPQQRIPLTVTLPTASFQEKARLILAIADAPEAIPDNNARAGEQTGIGAASAPTESRSGFLGLTVDKVNCEIRRDGNAKIIRLNDAPNEWHTFFVAYKAGKDGATKKRWMNGYPGDKGGRGPSQAKRRLGEKLAEIGLTLPAGSGVRLTERQ